MSALAVVEDTDNQWSTTLEHLTARVAAKFPGPSERARWIHKTLSARFGYTSADAGLHWLELEQLQQLERLPELTNGQRPELANGRARAPAILNITTAHEFAAVQEPGAGALVGDGHAALIPENGDIMIYGDGGAGKTTLANDLNAHLAAGDAWLDVAVGRALNLLIVENEGPRALFRAKLRAKLDGWQGSPIGERLHVLTDPWTEFTFADEGYRVALAEAITKLELDMVTIGPVVCAGMSEAGTLQQTRAFQELLGDVRARAERLVTFCLVHHENKGGSVSGAWEGVGDTLFHVTGQGPGRTRLYIQKARWSTTHHMQTIELRWTDGEGFAVVAEPKVDDDMMAESILRAVTANPGTGWTRVEEMTPGMKAQSRRAVRDRLLKDGRLLNVTTIDGRQVALDHCPERKQASLFLVDDPTIAHLRPDPDAAGTQAASLWPEGR